MTTLAPCIASSRAMPLPMPRDPPVTRAVFPSSVIAISRPPRPGRFLQEPPSDQAPSAHPSARPPGTRSLPFSGVSPSYAPTAPVSYTHLRAHETRHDLVCRLLLEKKKQKNKKIFF